MFTAVHQASSISQALPKCRCPTEKVFFLSGFITLKHWSMKKSQLQECFHCSCCHHPVSPISGDFHPPEHHRPLPIFLMFLLSDVLFSNNQWRKEHWLLTQLWLPHRSTTLWEEEGKVEVSLHVCEAQEPDGPSELSRVDNGTNGIGYGSAPAKRAGSWMRQLSLVKELQKRVQLKTMFWQSAQWLENDFSCPEGGSR